jgi:hypothetical protein
MISSATEAVKVEFRRFLMHQSGGSRPAAQGAKPAGMNFRIRKSMMKQC